jgi:UDP-glucose 4-epimerase
MAAGIWGYFLIKTSPVNGGTYLIGSHACVALSQLGHKMSILSNLCNSCAYFIEILTAPCDKRLEFI